MVGSLLKCVLLPSLISVWRLHFCKAVGSMSGWKERAASFWRCFRVQQLHFISAKANALRQRMAAQTEVWGHQCHSVQGPSRPSVWACEFLRPASQLCRGIGMAFLGPTVRWDKLFVRIVTVQLLKSLFVPLDLKASESLFCSLMQMLKLG